MSKKAIVTGASRGIGKGIALALAREGYDLAISYASKAEAARALSETIRTEFGRACHPFQVRLEEKGACHKFFQEAVDALNGLDVLVNNAGKRSASLSTALLRRFWTIFWTWTFALIFS